MKKLLILFVLAGIPAMALASSEGPKLDPVSIDLSDTASLQRGARTFVNYCLSCHSASYMRYNRMGKDLGLSDEMVKENLMFASSKIGDLMKAAIPAEDAKAWFGVVPPDLTDEARYRGPSWIYTYMRGFYRDEKTQSGWNNTVFPAAAMPHVLIDWQGQQRAVFKADAEGVQTFDHFELDRAGTMNKEQFDGAVRDLVNFMVYMGEPAKLVRYRLGVMVLAFLAFFLIFAYLLKKEYWKDVH
jgi:ubiquinol-cytochrome c reductase cytochrome c1 subunit